MNATDLAAERRQKVRASMGDVRAGLERLVRIPSLSAAGYEAAAVQRSAELTAELFNDAGVKARVVGRSGAHPAVVGRVARPRGTPTGLLYAHHHVEPPRPPHPWHT